MMDQLNQLPPARFPSQIRHARQIKMRVIRPRRRPDLHHRGFTNQLQSLTGDTAFYPSMDL